MKRFFFLLLALAFLSVPAYATDILVTIQTLSQVNFNPSSLGNDLTINNVTVTNASFTITSPNAFPQSAVGMGGFQVLIAGNQYEVESVLSRSSANLTQQYAGSTASVSITWYKWAVMRIYNTSGFSWQPNGNSELIQPGTPGSGNWYKSFACSLTNPGSGNILWIPAFTIPATIDSPTNNQAKFSFIFYTPSGSLLNYFQCGSTTQFSIPTATPTTLAAICTYNSPGAVVPPNTESYTKPQIDQRLPSCLASALPYFASNGNVMSCLTLGSEFSITSTILGLSAATTFTTSVTAPRFIGSGVAFTNLGTTTGQILICTDCQVTSGADNTCAGGGTGALVVRLNGVNRCFSVQN